MIEEPRWVKDLRKTEIYEKTKDSFSSLSILFGTIKIVHD